MVIYYVRRSFDRLWANAARPKRKLLYNRMPQNLIQWFSSIHDDKVKNGLIHILCRYRTSSLSRLNCHHVHELSSSRYTEPGRIFGRYAVRHHGYKLVYLLVAISFGFRFHSFLRHPGDITVIPVHSRVSF